MNHLTYMVIKIATQARLNTLLNYTGNDVTIDFRSAAIHRLVNVANLNTTSYTKYLMIGLY